MVANRKIGLVSCVKMKRNEPVMPKDLYTSNYSQKMRAYAETHQDEWWILSTKHRLIAPDDPPIEPDDETLTTGLLPCYRAFGG